MENVIQLDFTNKTKNLDSFFQRAKKEKTDPVVMSYLLYDIIECHQKHFEDNVKTSKYEISSYNESEFMDQTNKLKSVLGRNLERLHDLRYMPAMYHEAIREEVAANLTKIAEVDVQRSLEYFEAIGIPYTETKVINIGNYLGLKNHR